jgi:hypothetical protein
MGAQKRYKLLGSLLNLAALVNLVMAGWSPVQPLLP